MDVSQYPIKWGFGITSPTPPWSPTHPHLGVDRSCPLRTPLKVNGQLIGYSGNSGPVAAHHHLQKVKDGMVVDPKKEGFSIPTPAVVFETGEKPEIGKFIRIRDAQGVEWSHFHLDEILVNKGQQIGADMWEGHSAEYWFNEYEKKAALAAYREERLNAARSRNVELEKQLKECQESGGDSGEYEQVTDLYRKKS